MDLYMKGKGGKYFEVYTDTKKSRLWINAEDGSSVARINVNSGVDVHNSVTDQMNGAPQCAWCTHVKPDLGTCSNLSKLLKRASGLVYR